MATVETSSVAGVAGSNVEAAAVAPLEQQPAGEWLRFGAAAVIEIFSATTRVSSEQLAPVVIALQEQIHHDFKPHWNTGAHLVNLQDGAIPSADAWWLGVFDHADQAGALGYHDLTTNGLPLGKVFLTDASSAGVPLSSVMSHELLEMVADPFIFSTVQISTAQFTALEVCDPCEANSYQINGVTVSDFVTPGWFVNPPLPGPVDLLNAVSGPLTLATGGYMSLWTPQGGWTQKFADAAGVSNTTAPNPEYLARTRGLSTRLEKRARGYGRWLRSTV